MANTLLTAVKIARRSLFEFDNALIMAKNVYREFKNDIMDGDSGSVTIRKPVRFVVSDGATRVNQDVTEKSTSITVDKRKHVSWKLSTQDLTLTIDKYAERYIKPAMIQLANQVDLDLHALHKDIAQSVGTPGTTPATFLALSDAAEMLDNMAVPDDGERKMVLNPKAKWAMANVLQSLNNPAMVNTLVKKGLISQIANMEVYGTQNIATHTVGPLGGVPLVDGAAQVGSSLVTTGWTAAAALRLNYGDVFTIAGVYAVNPITRQSTGELKQFSVTAPFSSDVAGEGAISISPEIITTGPYQNVDVGPADTAALTVLGTAATAYPQNLAFHKNALALVTVPLELPRSAGFKSRATHNGLSIRIIEDYDIIEDEEIIRCDIFYGVKKIYDDLATRVWG